MFEIRKIQEAVIYQAVKDASNDEAAKEIVCGQNGQAKSEDDPTWVKSTMMRLKTVLIRQPS